MADLQRAVGAKEGAVRREVGECAKLWNEIGKLPGQEAFVQSTVNQKRRSYSRTVLTTTYHIERFKELWNIRQTDNVGASILTTLLPFGQRRTVEEIDDEMKQRGFVGIRLYRAKRLAGVKAILPEGCHGGAAWLYVRSDPKKKAVGNGDVQQIIKDIFARGGLRVTTYNQALEEKGLSRQVGAVMRAERELGYETTRRGPRGSPWICRIKGLEWPSADPAPSNGTPREKDKEKTAKRRRRNPQQKTYPLTERQAETVHLMGEHKGNRTAVARAMGVSRAAIIKLYKKAITKLGKTAIKRATQGLPTDKRGQVTVPDSSGDQE
jgi:hypothetical protein